MPDKYNRHWEGFPSHTRLKHAILRAYLRAWARILFNSGYRTIWFVDGFAGRGKDEQGLPGSPLIACQIAEEVRAEFSTRSLSVRIRIAAVESKPDNFTALRENVGDSACSPVLYRNRINEQYPEILRMIGSAPALFFLDPWGVEGLSADMIAEMLTGQRREVLLLFSEHGAHRLATAAAADLDDEAYAQTSLFGDEETRPNPLVSGSDFREADEAILQDVFAGLWRLVEEAAAHNPGMERRTYLESYLAIQERLGAKYVLPMSIVDENDHHHYSLVHASKNGKAIVAMKEALNTAMNQRAKERGPVLLEEFHIISPGLSRVCDQIAEHFEGKTVRWDERGNDDTVKRYALQDTWALVRDMQDVKTILSQRGYVITKKPLAFSFPALSNHNAGRE